MIRVLVMAESSLLADAIESTLSREMDLEVVRLKYDDLSKVYQTTRKAGSVVVIVEEGKTNGTFAATNDLLPHRGCFRIITISSQNHYLHIFDGYQMPISGMAQVINLAKGVNREHGSDAIE